MPGEYKKLEERKTTTAGGGSKSVTTQEGDKTKSSSMRVNLSPQFEWDVDKDGNWYQKNDENGNPIISQGYKNALEEWKASHPEPKIGDFLISPEVRAAREQQIKNNRTKELMSGLYHTGALISDMISAGVGGNVWKRDKDDTVARAEQENVALREKTAADDAAAQAALQKEKVRYLSDRDNYLDKWLKTNEKTVTTNESTTQHGKKETKMSKNPETRTTTVNRLTDDNGKFIGGGSSSSSSSSSGGGDVIKIPLQNGQTVDIIVPSGNYKASGHYLSALYNALGNQGKNNIDKVLSEHGIEPQETGKGKYTYDGVDLLSSGIVFDNKEVLNEYINNIDRATNLTPEEKRLVKSQLKTYPLEASKEKKKSWLRRMLDKITGSEEDNGGFNPDGASTDGGL